MDIERQFYQYSALHADPKEDVSSFRLLSLLPGTDGESLHGEIHEAQLDSSATPCQDYEALSYCCGDSTEIARITIQSQNGGYLPLGRNLFKALSSLRLPATQRVLWVDAICINQNDLEERALEVRLMHRIYQRAQKVLIWLDQPDIKPKHWNPVLAFAYATRLAEIRETNPDIDLRKMNRFRKVLVGRRYKIKRHKTRGNSHERPPDALRMIFHQPWFERMWVVQEATCATTAIIMCGEVAVDFDIFMQGVEFGLRSGFFESSRQRGVTKRIQLDAPLSNISAAMEMYLLNSQSSLQEDLLSLLRRFHGSKSADPRDKLFALYGISSLDRMSTLAHDFRAIGIVPDYQIDPVKLYVKVARGILHQSQNLDLLSVSSRHDLSKSRVGDLPSWVPDWSIVDLQTASLSYGGPTRYSASKGSKAGLPFISPDSPEFTDRTISLSGFYFDRIAEVGIRPVNKSWKVWNDPKSASNPNMMIIVTFERWIWQVVDWQYDYLEDSKPGSYATVEDVVDLCWELILAVRNQFETAWYITTRRNTDVQPKYWGRWCCRQIDKLRKRRHLDSQWLFFSAVMLSMFQKGLKMSGKYDEAIVQSRTLARTENGRIGLVPLNARPGDSIALCRGGKTPLVIRLDAAEGETPRLKLVGDAYFHGVMHGQAWDEGSCGPIVLA